MVSATLLLIFLLIAAYTDVRWRRIPNRLTYSGILSGLALSMIASCAGWDRDATDFSGAATWGIAPWSDSWIGCFACGAIMLAGYVVFPGAVGGGDLKLLAMMGAFLGLHAGLEALLWTMVLGGCMAAIVVIWQVGIGNIVRAGLRALWALARWQRPASTGWPALRQDLFLSPSALAATLLVVANNHFHWW